MEENIEITPGESSELTPTEKILADFAQLKANLHNSECADCKSSESSQSSQVLQELNWVSVNNGVFLCVGCAMIHKEVLTKEISDVRMVPSIVGSS